MNDYLLMAQELDYNLGSAFMLLAQADFGGDRAALAVALATINRERVRSDGHYSADPNILGKIVAHETNPEKAMLLWYIVAADKGRSDQRDECLTEVATRLEVLLDGDHTQTDP